MKIDKNYVLKGENEENLQQDGKDFTLGGAITNILLRTVTESPDLSYKLVFKINKENDLDLSVEDVAFIKKTVKENKSWLPLVTGQICFLLENGTQTGDKETSKKK